MFPGKGKRLDNEYCTGFYADEDEVICTQREEGCSVCREIDCNGSSYVSIDSDHKGGVY